MSEQGGLFICRPSPLWSDKEQGLALLSDLHIGSATVDYQLIEEELRYAAARNYRVLINGDVWENLFHQNQKQFNPSAIHRRIRGASDPINRCLDWAVELFAPYAHLVDIIGVGNHCVRSEKHCNTDMTLLLVKELQRLSPQGHTVFYGGYQGFVDYKFISSSRRLVIYYHHGWGSGSSLSSSAADLNRALHIERADVVWLGHKHSRMNAHVSRPSCPSSGSQPKMREVRFIRTGSYMDPLKGQTQSSVMKYGRKGNYAADAGLMTHGKGGAVLLINPSRKSHTLKVVQ